MAIRFFVPKFITLEDKLAGILTFKQLFALLGAFLLTFFMFKINKVLGIIVGFLSFGSAIVLTFFNVNGKPVLYVFPKIIEFFLKDKKFQWKKIEKITYQKIAIPTKSIKEIESAEITLEYPYTNIKEKLKLSLKEPISKQTENIESVPHKHTVNPKNPYHFFPYIKFYKTLK
jgi:hypothetical protein